MHIIKHCLVSTKMQTNNIVLRSIFCKLTLYIQMQEGKVGNKKVKGEL